MADQGAHGELLGNPTAGLGMYWQARQNVNPGYVRKLHLTGPDSLGLVGSIFSQYQSGQVRVAEGVGGINFGLGPIGMMKRTDVGFPSAPCQLQHGPGRIIMPIPVLAGARTVSIYARWYPDSGSGQRPRLLVKRDLDIGIQNDIFAEAGAGGGLTFVQITLNVTVAVEGVLECYREQQDQRADAWTMWDHLHVT